MGTVTHTHNVFVGKNTYERDDQEATCDAKYILDVFSLATTASAVEINLRPSLELVC